jgi:hypothetical protein
LNREETANLEAERKAVSLPGVRFRYYDCILCNRATIVLQVRPLVNETRAAFFKRQQTLDRVAREIRQDDLQVITEIPGG